MRPGRILASALLILSAGCRFPAPSAVTLAPMQYPGPRDLAGEQQIRQVIARLDAAPHDSITLAPESVEIGSDGRVSPLIDATQPTISTRAGENVAVLASLGIETSQVMTRGVPDAYYRELYVLRRIEGRFEALAAAHVRLVPSPGPDPWSSDYWRWHFAPKVPPPPVAETLQTPGHSVADAQAEAEIRALITRFELVGLQTRTAAEQADDLRFLTRDFYAPDNIHIAQNGMMERVAASAGPPRWMAGFTCTMDGISVVVSGEIAVATFRETRKRQSMLYSRDVMVFRHQTGGWREVADMGVQLIPESGPDPWGWMRFRS